MSIIRIPPVLRSEAGGAREVEASGSTVRELLEDLRVRVPALGARVFAEGEIQPFVNVYVDGEDVRTRNGLETPVREGATVILLPAMAGGAFTALTGGPSRAAAPPSAAVRRR
jgi:molybdopterin converting factor small subunit